MQAQKKKKLRIRLLVSFGFSYQSAHNHIAKRNTLPIAEKRAWDLRRGLSAAQCDELDAIGANAISAKTEAEIAAEAARRAPR